METAAWGGSGGRRVNCLRIILSVTVEEHGAPGTVRWREWMLLTGESAA